MPKQAQNTQADLADSAHKIWLAGLGALAVAEEEGTRLFKRLVEKGEGFEAKRQQDLAQVKKRVTEARGKVEEGWERLGETFDQRLTAALQRLGVPTRDEIRELSRRVEELTAKLEQKRATPRSGGKAGAASS